LREQVPGIPPTVEAVVLKALEKDPHRRFTSVQEFATAFEQACQTLLPVSPAMLPNSRIWVASASHALEEALFYASPTLVESTLQPPESGKRGISRRELLVAQSAWLDSPGHLAVLGCGRFHSKDGWAVPS
jgi:hypothetical protein